ncbi:hypothetical protein [Pseudoalteromonas sp. T1lg22]|uniref:hypothetical protein n=1 Tax=Pseudoalteromonas sp. T1lg22 TaxID=2077096 RepID=UPI001319FDA5|nr:hypothetical protein [Pseudoalteromonas sp. T1lg22]
MANLSTLIRYPLLATATLACMLASDTDVYAAHNIDINDSYALHTTGSSIGSQWQLSNPLFSNNPLRIASRTQLPYAAKSIDALVSENISGGTPTANGAAKTDKLDPKFNLQCASSVLTINAGDTAKFNCESRIIDGFNGTLRLSLASSLPVGPNYRTAKSTPACPLPWKCQPKTKPSGAIMCLRSPPIKTTS